MSWMAWTLPTAIFFVAIAIGLTAFTIMEVLRPTTKEKNGFLPMSTTRGDRFFISLLGSAFMHIIFLGLAPSLISIGSIISIAWVIIVLGWG